MKAKSVLLLIIIVIMGTLLTGCGDNENPIPSYEITWPVPQRPRNTDEIPRDDPNRPPPVRNPDGSLG